MDGLFAITVGLALIGIVGTSVISRWEEEGRIYSHCNDYGMVKLKGKVYECKAKEAVK